MRKLAAALAVLLGVVSVGAALTCKILPNGIPVTTYYNGYTGKLDYISCTDSGTLVGSSVTVQGNTFNGPSQLVQLNGASQLPAVSGALLTSLPTQVAGVNTNVQYNNAGAFGGSNNFTWNGSQLLVTGTGRFTGTLTLDSLIGAGNGYIPFVDGSGNLSQYNFFTWDASNHRIGIGYAFPSHSIDTNLDIRWASRWEKPQTKSGSLLNGMLDGMVYASGDVNLANTFNSALDEGRVLKIHNVAGIPITVSGANGNTIEGGNVILQPNESVDVIYASYSSSFFYVLNRYYSPQPSGVTYGGSSNGIISDSTSFNYNDTTKVLTATGGYVLNGTSITNTNASKPTYFNSPNYDGWQFNGPPDFTGNSGVTLNSGGIIFKDVIAGLPAPQQIQFGTGNKIQSLSGAASGLCSDLTTTCVQSPIWISSTTGFTYGTAQSFTFDITGRMMVGAIKHKSALLQVGGQTILGQGLSDTLDLPPNSLTVLGETIMKSSAAVQGPGGLNVTYNVNAGSTTGSGLTTCGDTTHALGWSSSNSLFTCQSITGTGGGVALNSSPTWTGSHLFAEAAGSNSIAIQPPVGSTGTGWNDGTSGALLLDNSNNTGVGVQLYTTGGGSNQAPPLYIRVTSSTFAQPNIYVNSDSTDPNNPGIRINTKWPKIDFVNTNLGGSVKYQFANPLAADYFQINGRRGDNSQFDTIVRLYRKGSSTNGGLGFNALMLMTTGQLMLNDGTDTNYVAFSASESVTASYQMVLPAAAGTANQFFKIASVSGSRSNLSFSGVSATTDLSGTLQAAQFPALTGDITTAGGSLATTMASSIAGDKTWAGKATFASTVTANAGFYFGGAASKSANYTMVSTDTVIFASAPLTTNGGITITLPSAANLGQTIRVLKVDTSSNPVTLARAGSDLIVGTQTLVLPSFGASQKLISDGVSNWFPDGKIAASVPFIGHNFDPNGAAAVTASSNAYSNAIYVPEPCTVKGVRFVVGVQFGNMDVALLDSTGKRLGSSGGTAVPAPGIQSINLTAPTAILPGTYYLTMAVSNSTATFARYSIDSVAGNFVNTASYPIPANLALTTAGSRNFSLVGLVYGGVTQ